MINQIARRAFSTSRSTNYSKIILLGNIGSDIENGQTPNGRNYAKYSIAVSVGRTWRIGGQDSLIHEREISLLNDRLGKGARILVEGTPNVINYETDGRKHSSVQVLVNRIEIIRFPKREEATEGASAHQSSESAE